MEFHILGPPILTTNGKAVRLHSAKAIALLAYLVCEADVPHSRDKLATLLWADASDSRARQSLRQVLYSLRRALGPLADECLLVDRDAITLQCHPAFHVDVLEFDRLATAENNATDEVASLARVATLYRGPLLEGFVLDASPDFDEWLLLVRARLGQQAIRLLQLAIDGCLAAGDIDEADRFGHRLLALDNLNEGAYRRLMRVHAAQGDRDAVRRQYRQCANILMAELGVEPTSATTALCDDLFATATVVSIAAAQTPKSAALSLPFQGCEEELAGLTSALMKSMDGQSSLVFVCGESGVGKSRLLQEFMRRTIGHRQLQWLQGRCYKAELGAPYTMWADALSSLSRNEWQPLLNEAPAVWRQQLARLLPGLMPTADEIVELPAAEGQLRLMQGVVHTLAHLAKGSPLILCFDDIHWSDASSLELLHYAARHLESAPILLIAAFRPESVGDNPHLQTILSETSASVVEARPLDVAGVGDALAGLDLASTPEMASRLHQHCGGNRFMLTETLRALVDLDALGELAGSGPLPVPLRVQDLTRSRIATLDDTSRRVLAAAAVIGRPCDLVLLRHVSGQPEMALMTAVDELVNRAFLAETVDGGAQALLTFHHDFVGRVAYAELRHSQRRALHRRTADALLSLQHRSPNAIVEEVAYHYQQAADAKALTYLRTAAQQAEAIFALPHATDLYTRALDFQRVHLGDEPSRRFELLFAREALLEQQGRRAEQADDIVELLSIAAMMDDPKWLAKAYIRQAGYLSNTGQSAQSHAVAEQALALYHNMGARSGEAQAVRELGFLYWSTSDYGRALEYNRRALQLHRQLGDTDGAATALHNLAEIYRDLDSSRQALAHYEQALELLWARQAPRRQGLTLYGMAHTLRQAGDRAGALVRYQQALAQTKAAEDKLMTSRVHHALASLATEDEELEQALGHLQRAVELSQEFGYALGMAHGLVGLSYLYAHMTQPDAAVIALQDALHWFQLLEDKAGITEVSTRLQQLRDDPSGIAAPPAQMGWIRSHVVLTEGKVYCEFESPLARVKSA